MKRKIIPAWTTFLKSCPRLVQNWLGVQYSGREKRVYPRREIYQFMKYRYEYVHVQNPRNEFVAKLHDISEGGVCFTSRTPVAREMVLSMVIDMEELEARIPVTARTIWTQCFQEGKESVYRVGVAFLDLKEEYRKTIRDFVALGNLAN